MMPMKTLLWMMALAVMLAGCAENEDVEPSGRPEATNLPVVYVSNYPLKYFAERIAAPWADIRLPVPEGEDPAFWKPKPEAIQAMQRADLVVLNGASYESWLKTVSLPPSRLINTTTGFNDRLIPLAERTTHSHGLEGEHEHSGTAFTTWLDLNLAVEQVRAIIDAFSTRWPDHATPFKQAAEALERDLQLLDEQMVNIVRGAPDRPVLFSHPVYQYVQRRYGINGRSVHWEPDAMPDAVMWQALADLISEHPAKWMIWEGRPLPEIATRLESMGIQSVVFDPCASIPSQHDFLSMMQRNVEALRVVFEDH